MGFMRKPLVGITTYVTPAAFGAWQLESALIPYDYVRAVERAGARAVLVPPSDDGVEEILDAVDGLVFSGGSDLDPALYGADPHPETTGIRDDRDRSELAVTPKVALKYDWSDDIVFYGTWGTPSARNKIIAIPTVAQGYTGRAK